MARLDLILRKEEITKETVEGNVAVVFDILLATSTISSMLYHGAKEIIPVLNEEEALKEAEKKSHEDVILVGEYRGKTIEGFLEPFPTKLKEKVNGKTVIFTTTNGTVALKNAWAAKAIYAASMLNEETLTNYLVNTYDNQSITLICSGSSGQFNLEDFFGAGSFAKALLAASEKRGVEWELSDAALAALHFYKANEMKGEELLKESRVGKRLINEGYANEVFYTLEKRACPVVPRLDGDVLTMVENES